MTKSRQALCSVTAVSLLPEASSHKQEHIILSKEDLSNILMLLNCVVSDVKSLIPTTDYRQMRLSDYQTKLRYLSEVCEPPKDQPNEST